MRPPPPEPFAHEPSPSHASGHDDVDSSASRRPPVLIVVTSRATKGSTGQPTGYYLSEVTHPLAEFEAAGLKVEFAPIEGGEPPVDGLDLNDPVNARYWNDPHFRQALRETRPVSTVDPSRYAAVFFAGGHGTMWDFPGNADVGRIARQVYESGGVVAAVYHGPAALVDVKLSDGTYLVRGHEVAAFTNAEEEAVGLTSVVPFLLETRLEERGATHRAAATFNAQVVTSGRLVTGQNPASATGVGRAVVAVLEQASSKAR